MLEPAGDFGFEEESCSADRVIGVVVEDLLQRDLAIQFAVERRRIPPPDRLGRGAGTPGIADRPR